MARVFLFGHPVSHSLSPAMHNAAFAALGLPHRYETRDVDAADLASAVGGLRRDDVLGANVTIPHKEAALRLVDDATAESREIGAVNTLIRRGTRVLGANTDVEGFARAVTAADGGPLLSGRTVLLLGAGGAARACAYVLLPTNRVLVANRTPERARDFAAQVEIEGRHAEAVAWPGAGAALEADAVVNATPLGMNGEDPLAGMELPAIVVDIVPTAKETPLVRRAREAQHVVVVDGLAMLLHQAARSFELWTGVAAPVAAMRAALPRPA
ncbi:MAG TPA: shikimate dehydrogenase [Candidatus Acidoferrales bacterium]|nr:shikimate dehydrogenase [Candidatus Acidoferrales bacterium]